ncbi:Dethiobiotin synthase BioD (EC 6.3.3.3) [uncultured Gammaproteobacteria bacterium]|nr:Dethiobiotin synthase BioD (EC 6.3.3.3) [uncultured Gammaproteobacteria bacterium]
MKGLFVSGSGTEVGKTFIAERLVRLLSKTRSVAVRKPIESDCKTLDEQLVTKDAVALQKASNVAEDINRICCYQFTQCCSGESASSASGVTIGLTDLVKACQSDHYVMVEGAGGLLSPIAQDTLNIDLATALQLPLVLVVKDELGAVNQALLVIKAAEQYKLEIACVVLNQIKGNTLDNASVIRRYSSCEVVVYNDEAIDLFEQQISQILI